jgi:hypothetical protein
MTDETLRRLVDLIRTSVNCECVYLFGSRGTGTAQEGKSDYDLLVIASLPSLLASMRRFSSLRRALDGVSPVHVELVFITPQSAFRSRSSLFLMQWNLGRLVYGRKDILRDFRVGSFVPDQTSVVYQSCHEVLYYLLPYVKIDRNLGASIDHRALAKLSRLLEGDILLGAGSLGGLMRLASSIRTEAMKENCDVHSVCRSYADFFRGVREQFNGLDQGSALSQLRSTAYILAETLRFRTLAFARGRTAQYQFMSALMYFFQSMEMDPPSVDLLQKASRLLQSSFPSERALQELRTEDGHPFTLWAQVKSGLIENPFFMTSVMNYPFGLFILHPPIAPFITVLL